MGVILELLYSFDSKQLYMTDRTRLGMLAAFEPEDYPKCVKLFRSVTYFLCTCVLLERTQ